MFGKPHIARVGKAPPGEGDIRYDFTVGDGCGPPWPAGVR